MRLAFVAAFFAALLSIGSAWAQSDRNQSADTDSDKNNTLYIDLKDGRVAIEMYPKLAPKHVAQIKKLALEHKYDGIVFHRVIDGFMAQTGDPEGTGRGGMGDMLPAEFNSESFTRGAVGMARTQDPDSAQSQFFIVTKDSLFLDGQYTLWGRVVSGMEFVDHIKQGPKPSGMVPAPQDKMIKVRLATDTKE